MTRVTRFVARAVPRSGKRPGISLVEILVALAIIATLMALTTAALQKTTQNQKIRTSTDQVFKLQQALDQEYERVVQKCAADATNDRIPQQVVTACDGDKSRAKAAWTAFQLRLYFPDKFSEIKDLELKNGSGVTVYLAPPLKTFATVQGLTGGLPQDESGALLYMILAQRSVSGGGAMATSAEDLTQAMRQKVTFTRSGSPVELEAFSDAWKNSVGFQRWLQADEMQGPPYADSRPNKDPLDPQSLVAGSALPANNAELMFNTQKNRMATVYSVGVNRALNNGGDDDIFGFRLRKPGSRVGSKQP